MALRSSPSPQPARSPHQGHPVPIHPLTQRPSSSPYAFTLPELLLVIVVLTLLAAISISQIRDSRQQAARDPLQCQRNLQQIYQALTDFAADHNQQLPWELPASEGGTREAIPSRRATPHFQALTNYLHNIYTLQCPLDLNRRRDRVSMRSFDDSALSYAVNIYSTLQGRNRIWITDRTVSTTDDLTTGGLEIGGGPALRWAFSEDRSFGHELPGTREPMGNVLFGNGTLMEVSSPQLEKLTRSSLHRDYLVVP